MVSQTHFHRYDLDHLLPIVTRRVHAGDFAAQNEIARSYGIDKATAKRWRQRAVQMGLTTTLAWQRGLLEGRLARLSTNGPTLAAA